MAGLRTIAALALLLPAVFIAGCIGQSSSQAPDSSVLEQGKQAVSFRTEDGWLIFADYYPSAGEPVILLHMLGSSRAGWESFAQALNDKGFAVLVPDMRGHGNSVQSPDGQRSYISFATEDWLGTLKDVEAAKNFLENRNHDTRTLGIAGASIGANLALRYAVQDSDVKALALLSPGIDYRGVQTPDVVALYENSAIILASSGDSQSDHAARVLYDSFITRDQPVMQIYEGSAHGTELLAGSAVQELLLNWFGDKLVKQ